MDVLNYFDGINKNEIIYVGDAPSVIKACKTIGIPICAVAWADTAEPEKLKELMPEQLFTSIINFTNWISSKI